MGTPYYKDGATQRTITEIYYKDGATQRTITEGWIGDGGTNRQFYASTPSVAVNVANHTITGYRWSETNENPPPAEIKNSAIARFDIKNDGTLAYYLDSDVDQLGASESGTYSGEWLAAGAVADVEHRVTLLSGTGTEYGDTRNLWTSCSTTRTYGINVNYSSCPKTNVYLVEYRKASDHSALGSHQITLEAAT